MYHAAAAAAAATNANNATVQQYLLLNSREHKIFQSPHCEDVTCNTKVKTAISRWGVGFQHRAGRYRPGKHCFCVFVPGLLGLCMYGRISDQGMEP